MINKNVFEKTKYRLIKINILVVGSFLILFSIGIFFYFEGLTYNNVDKDLAEELDHITTQLSSSSFFSPLTVKNPSSLVYVYEGENVRYYTQNRYFDNILPPSNDDREDTFYTYIENGYTFRELKVNIGKYKIQIIKNIDSEISSLKQLIFVFIIGILIAILLTYFVAIYLTKKALVPIEIAWDNQAKFIQDASHELRTPVAIVSSKLEGLLKVPNKTIMDEVETVADAMREVRRLKKMITDLLSLTKEDTLSNLNIESFDMVEFLEEISRDYSDFCEIENKNFNLNCNLVNKNINTDKLKLRQLLIILLDNAVKYTNEGDKIYIDVFEGANNFEIIVGDSGIGIKEEEKKYIFDRFFRSENVRNKDIDGSGIGLSIANMISLNLGAKIYVKSEVDKGSEFKIIIPKNYK